MPNSQSESVYPAGASPQDLEISRTSSHAPTKGTSTNAAKGAGKGDGREKGDGPQLGGKVNDSVQFGGKNKDSLHPGGKVKDSLQLGGKSKDSLGVGLPWGVGAASGKSTLQPYTPDPEP